jgi:hypothetical protein
MPLQRHLLRVPAVEYQTACALHAVRFASHLRAVRSPRFSMTGVRGPAFARDHGSEPRKELLKGRATSEAAPPAPFPPSCVVGPAR